MNHSNGYLSVVVALTISLQGCATLTARDKSLLAIVGAGTVGAVVGANRGEPKTQNTVMYSSLFAAVAGAASLVVFDESSKQMKIRTENEELRSANNVLRLQVEPKFQSQGTSLLAAPLPQDLKRLIQPGGWKRYKLDRWIQDEGNENVWFRQTEMFEVTPPSVGVN